MQTVTHIARVSRGRESRHTRGGILAEALGTARSREPMPEAVENEVVKPEKPWRPKTVCFLGVVAYKQATGKQATATAGVGYHSSL